MYYNRLVIIVALYTPFVFKIDLSATILYECVDKLWVYYLH